MILNSTQSIFKKSCLASLIGLFCMPSAYALQQLSDDSLSETTGEGVALVLDDFKMVFQGLNNTSTGSSYERGIPNPQTADTGFIRIIPTGENYTNIGQRAYNGVYKNTYNNSVLDQKESKNYNEIYKTTFDATYQTTVTTLEAKYLQESRAILDRNKEGYKTQELNEIYASPVMRRYYDQRYQDYKRNSGKADGPENDGTKESYLAWNPFGWLDETAEGFAESNTGEMIELLYGSRWEDSIPNSSFLQSLGPNFVRQNLIEKNATDRIDAEFAVMSQSALARARSEATFEAQKAAQLATQAILETIVRDANIAASNAAANLDVGKLKTKADVFIYGLALSKSDGSLSSRYSNQGFNWGTAENPWLFRAGSENVRQFLNQNRSVGYLALEAPLALANPTSSAPVEDTFKLGFWTDIFARGLDTSNVVDPATGAPVDGLLVEDRLRTQFVANGLSLNGSQVRMFQTDKSANSNHNETLGMAALIRLNTDFAPHQVSADQGDELNRRGIRISTAGTAQEDNTVATPAQRLGFAAPVFNDVEGLYLYSPNINLVLGNMYQPFVFGSDGNNIVLEVTRIPNVPEIYNKIYQDYGFDYGKTTSTEAFQGSTCNYYQCGKEIVANNTTYQGRDATHSSISIGTVERLPNNMLEARKENNSTGIMFKNIAGAATNLGSVAIDGVLIQHLKIRTTGL